MTEHDTDQLEAELREELVQDADAALRAEQAGGVIHDPYAPWRPPKRRRYCIACDAELPEDDRFCEACGAAVLSESDEDRYRQQIEPALAKGRKWIAIVGALYIPGGLLFYATTEDPLVLWINFALALIHAGLWHWAKTNLLPAALTALVIFVTLHLADAVVDPSMLLRGVIIKVVFIVVLARAVSAGMEARRLRRGDS